MLFLLFINQIFREQYLFLFTTALIGIDVYELKTQNNDIQINTNNEINKI